MSRSDFSRYILYNVFVLQPLQCVSLIAFIFFIVGIAAEWVDMILAMFLLIFLISICYIIIRIRAKRPNDFLEIRKVPFAGYYIFQKIRKKAIKGLLCSDIHTKYFQDMHDALDHLAPGKYRTVTQARFTHAIKTCPRVTIYKKREIYHKVMTKLQREVFLGRCKSCSELCNFRANDNRQHTFYYLYFEVK